MSRNWIVAGDPTSSGGSVVTGSPFTDIDGIPVARVTDQATCPRDYLDMHPTSALCEAEEITLWTCEGNRKAYSLCSSREITEDAGYIQYRAGSGSEATFQFPRHKRHPAGIFSQELGPSGDVRITFENEGDRYTLVDRLRDTSSIMVSK